MADNAGPRRWQFTSIPQAHVSFLLDASPQVDRLLAIHETLGGTGRGRRYNLEVLNKSAIVLICAFWEAFVEDLAADALKHLAVNAKTARDLPLELRKSIVIDIEQKKHELAMWGLADDKWRDLLRDRAEQIISIADRTLSSPGSKKVEEFFARQAGIIHISDSWRWPGTSAEGARRKLDKFVELRNAIAHRGGPSNVTVLKQDAEKGLKLINHLAEASIGAVDQQLKSATGIPFIERFIRSEDEFRLKVGKAIGRASDLLKDDTPRTRRRRS